MHGGAEGRDGDLYAPAGLELAAGGVDPEEGREAGRRQVVERGMGAHEHRESGVGRVELHFAGEEQGFLLL